MKKLFLVLTMLPMLAQGQTLDDCQQAAEKNYPLIQQYGLIEKTTQLTVANIQKGWLPQVSASAQATYQSDVMAWPDGMKTMLSGMGVDVKGLKKDQYRVGIDVQQTIFDRFLQLVTQHCAEHHQIGYYAERMCLTERYLTTVIRQTSGTTAKDWIDRALITRIKIELRHTDKPAAQIADEMHFANPSFFSKYFRRITGMTPGEYREK